MTKRKPIKADKPVRVVRESKGSTPQDLIDMMNAEHQEWKTTKQVKYDSDGKRLD